MPKEENIFEAHNRIKGSLIFIISCYDTEYATKYIQNLNTKVYKKFFTIIKTDNTEKINEAYENSDSKAIIFIVKLPFPTLYSFDVVTNTYHIHLAVPWAKSDTNYLNDIKKVHVHKFINVKDDRKDYYDNTIEDKIHDVMINLVNDKLLNKSKGFKRMSAGNNKFVIYGSRELVE
jgi:hypothetical protein